MKNYTKFLSVLVGAALLAVAGVASADSIKQGVVTIVRIQGNAQYSIDGGSSWVQAVTGKELPPGSIVKSGDMSVVDLLVGKSGAEYKTALMSVNTAKNPAPNGIPLVEKNMIRLRPNTILGIDKLTVSTEDGNFVNEADLDLKKGRIFASVKKVSPSSEYMIKIPNGVAAVRGTQFELSSDSSGSECGVASGTVWISFTITDANGNPVVGPDGKPFAPVQVTLNPGQEIKLDAGLLKQLSDKIGAANTGGTVTQADLDALAAAIETLASSGIQSIDPSVLSLLQMTFAGLGIVSVQYGYTAHGDNGNSINVSSH